MAYFDSVLSRAHILEPVTRPADVLGDPLAPDIDQADAAPVSPAPAGDESRTDVSPSAPRPATEPPPAVTEPALSPAPIVRNQELPVTHAPGTEPGVEARTAGSSIEPRSEPVAPEVLPAVAPRPEPVIESAPLNPAVDAELVTASTPQPAEMPVVKPRPPQPVDLPAPAPQPQQTVVMPAPPAPDVGIDSADSAESTPNVSISIGRIVVQTPESKPLRSAQAQGVQQPARTDSLADYLKRRQA